MMLHQSLVCGGSSNFVIEQDTVWCWGHNLGALGLGVPEHITQPRRNPHLHHPILAIASNVEHTLSIDHEGFLWAFGTNQCGELGIPGKERRYYPCRVKQFTRVLSIAAGFSYSIVLDGNHTVWGFGFNSVGQLGMGDIIDRVSPRRILPLTNIRAVATGLYHSLALDDQGDVWCFGGNDTGQLGLGDTESRLIPTLNPYLHFIVRIYSTMGLYSIVVDDQSVVWGFGETSSGQLGIDPENNPNSVLLPMPLDLAMFPVSVACGNSHVIILDDHQQVWAMGSNSELQLGVEDVRQTAVPVRILDVENIIQIAAGWNHSIACDGEGTLWVWGSNSACKLGLGATNKLFFSLPRKVDHRFDLAHVISSKVKSANSAVNDGDPSDNLDQPTIDPVESI